MFGRWQALGRPVVELADFAGLSQSALSRIKCFALRANEDLLSKMEVAVAAREQAEAVGDLLIQTTITGRGHGTNVSIAEVAGSCRA